MANGVDDDQHVLFYYAKSFRAYCTIFLAVVEHCSTRGIDKDTAGISEGDTMFSQILCRFLRIPCAVHKFLQYV